MGSLLVAESDSEEYYFSEEGPGQRLQSAREALHLDIGSVARSLHLTRDMVHALEGNEYDRLPAPVFVRGYLRNYARLLGEPVEPILRAYSESNPAETDGQGALRTPNMEPQISANHFLVRLVTWGIAIGLLALLVIWWQGYLENGAPPPQTPNPTPEMEAETASALPPPRPIPGAADNQPASDADAPTGPAVAGDAAEIPPAADSPPAGDADAAAQTAETNPDAAGAADADAPEPAADADQPSVVLEFSNNSWVNIKDADGKTLILGELADGERRTLDGRPPYRIVLGRAQAVSLTVNGKPYDLGPHTQANVARFSLDPENVN